MGDLRTVNYHSILKITLTSLIAAFACTGIIYAATTVGTNINTTGTLTATGLTTMGNASSTLFSVSGTGYIGGSNGLILADGSITDASGSIDFGNEQLTTTGNIGIGTSSPYAKLSVVGEVVGSYFTATSTTATSTFTNAAITGGEITGLYNFGVSGDVTITGTVDADKADIYDSLANTDVGTANFGAITTGYQNIMLGAVNGNYVTTGFRNIGIGRVAIERVSTGSNNIGIGYSMLVNNTGSANTAVGTHACGGIWGGQIWTDGDWDYNTCFGFEAGNSATYNYHTYTVGEYNLFLGTKTGGVGQEGSTSLYNVDHTTLIGHGAAIGTNQFKEVTGIAEEAVGGDVQITATAHGYSDGDFITFRDIEPQGFIEQVDINSCALVASVYGLFKVSSATTNTFELDWCRSAGGTTSNWNSTTVSSPAYSSLSGGMDWFVFASDATAHNNKAIMFIDSDVFKNTFNSGIKANVPYWLCNENNDGTATGADTVMTLRTRRGTCDGTATTEFLNFASDYSDLPAPKFASVPYQCDSWVKANWTGSYTVGGKTQNFTSCTLDDTQGDGGKGYVAKVEINSEGGSDLNYDFTTAIGANAVANCSNCVVLGRAGATKDKVGIATSSPAVELDVNGLIKAHQTASTTCSGSVIGSIFYNSANDSFWGCKSTGWQKLDN